ncbi:hypothetical protein [Nocardia blacklockiae]|uniref:hypothetical protein n=1 Tax=Nocardia blacklockiae TaxID=480036 RepID=UPI0018946CEC|nr:hypothetical protein [Nocardia blacklockiae]MBF6171302.1 hypothetical protein [Nocardia blacklockiae]
MELYFSDYFEVDPENLERYGALDISVVTDLPLFIDPFLLFNSEKPEYQQLHEDIIRYLAFLRDEANPDLDPALVKAWYRFKEVKQNWLGFTVLGNSGHALGRDFANALHSSLGSILSNFGREDITRSSHLEKLALIKGGVGRDSISDFTTNLIKDYLLLYTEAFAKEHLDPKYCAHFSVPHARFNYETKTWETRKYYLPKLRNDYVVLTPLDMLTRDETWINYSDMIRQFDHLPDAVDNDQLRAQINQYFRARLGKKPSAKDRAEAAAATVREFRELVDLYIKLKEDSGDNAQAISSKKTDDTRTALVEQVRAAIVDIEKKTNFYDKNWSSYDEARERVLVFKHYVEHQDGYKLINRGNGEPFSNETEVQLFFGLAWCSTDFDVNREPNNGRGPVDFKVSYGAGDKSLIEFKLAKSSSLKRNLEKQVAIYEKANKTDSSLKVIICYTAEDQAKLRRVLVELGLADDESIIAIDARSDNKPSASTA